VRNQEMHRRAEFGVAAHWGYKEGASSREIAWMQRLADVEEEEADPIAFLEALKLDLGQDEVYVFTPKGRVIALIEGATTIDFAYAVHTEVGHHCVGAKVNGRLVPLDTVLHSADVVEIVTSKNDSSGPSRDWLKLAKSSRAKSKIRQWFQRERREDAIEGGREELIKALRREGLPVATSMSSGALDAVITSLTLEDLDALFLAIDSNQISALAVVQRLSRELHGGEAEQLPTTVSRQARSSRTARRSAGVYVEGLDDVMIHLARCCSPVPGDSIMGFITQGRGVAVTTVRTRWRWRIDWGSGSLTLSGTARPEASTAPSWRLWPSTARACCSTSPRSSPSTTSTSSRAAPRRRVRESCE